MKKLLLFFTLLLIASPCLASTREFVNIPLEIAIPSNGECYIYNSTSRKFELQACGGGGGGASQLSDLSDVSTSTPTNRNALVANGTAFVSRALVEADISDLQSYLTSEVDGSTTNELQNIFQTFSCPSGTSPVADSTTDTLTFSAGTGITISGNSTTDTVTITNTVTDTNANSICSGTTTYLDGEGNCDDISSVYAAMSHTHTESDISDLTHYTSSDFDTDFAGKSTTNLSEGTNLYYTDARVSANASVAANTAKVTNATHTGEVTGSTTLTVSNTAITNQTTVTAASGDFVLITDASDSNNLKKVNASDFLGGAASAKSYTIWTNTTTNNSANSASWQNLASFTLSADELSTGNVVSVRMQAGLTNTGSARDYTFRCGYGGTYVTTNTEQYPNNATEAHIDITFELIAAGSTSAQEGWLTINTGIKANNSDVVVLGDGGTFAIDSTSDHIVNCQILHGSTNANQNSAFYRGYATINKV